MTIIRKFVSFILFTSLSLCLLGTMIPEDCDSLKLSGYIKDCSSENSCRLYFFDFLFNTIDNKFSLKFNDTIYDDTIKIKERTDIFYTILPFLLDADIKADSGSLSIVSYRGFRDTLFFKSSKPSKIHFKRDNVIYTSVFTNYFVYSVKDSIRK